MTATVKLSKPITVGDDVIPELQLREPTVDDVGELGYPFLLIPGDNGAAVEMRPKIVMKYASRLAGVPPSALRGISLADLSSLQSAVMGFFGDEAETSQT